MTVDLAAVSANLEDDLEVGNDPATYQDQQGPAPLKEGTYRLRVEGWDLDKDQSGELRLADGKYPTVVLKKVVVVEPVELEGKVAATFVRVATKPRLRYGQKVQPLGDLVRSFDSQRGFAGFKQGLEILKEQVDTGATFRASTRWEAMDLDWFREQVAAAGPIEKEQEYKLRDEATIKGMSKFPVLGDGNRSGAIVHPKSGNTLTARAVLDRYIPSHVTAKLAQRS